MHEIFTLTDVFYKSLRQNHDKKKKKKLSEPFL